MANTFTALFRGAASTGSTTLYTVPAATKTLVTSITVANTASADATFDLELNSFAIANDVAVAANDSITWEVKQVLDATNTITGLASATTVNFHISGLEIS
jgi:predicted nuclease of predicted toxin-antitoxin system